MLARNYVFDTNKSVFLTGRAGTGKTTFLTDLRKSLPKRMVVVAPTGVAAINAGGVTAHSFFQLPFGPVVPGALPKEAGFHRFSRNKINLIRRIELLVIDEISMLRADLLDAIDRILRRFRNPGKPFGGVQLLLIGDLQQLAPVASDEEWALLQPYYDTMYFFSSRALKEMDLVRIELTHIYRQTDSEFIGVLNKLRDNQPDEQTLEILNRRYIPSFRPADDEGYIRLTTHNYRAQQINAAQLASLDSPSYFFKAEIDGDFPAYAYPTEEKLELRLAAQVMFVKNDVSKDKRYFNGKIGRITRIGQDFISVLCPEEADEIEVETVTWPNVKYTVNPETKEITEEIAGTFTQYPLKLAWSITIHKSQGLTFEKAIIDAGSSFAHGQVYVALSRCKTLEGMVLSSPIRANSIKTDRLVTEYSRESEALIPDGTQLEKAKSEFEQELILELFDWRELSLLFNRLKRVVGEFQSVGTADRQINPFTDSFEAEIFRVADQFRKQLSTFFYEGRNIVDELFSDRIQKASAYFLEKIEGEPFNRLAELSPQSDNKEFLKQFSEIRKSILQHIHVKKACLKMAGSGFSVREYQRTKTDAELEFEERLIAKQPVVNPANNGTNSSLFNELKDWRDRKAAQSNAPVYMILQVKTLQEIARIRPVTINEIRNIKGMGKVKIKQFGNEIIEIVKVYAGNSEPETSKKEIQTPVPKPEKPKSSDLTLQLYREGNNRSEIAAIRKLALSTIEGHLLEAVRGGEINVFELYEQEKIELVCEYLNRNPESTLTEAHTSLKGMFSFNEIRAAVIYRERSLAVENETD